MIRKSLFSFGSLAASAPLILAVSVLYDMIFFRVFGLSLSVIPSSLNSHFKSALDFAVSAGVLIFLVVLVSIILLKEVEKSESADENKGKSWRTFFMHHASTLVTGLVFLLIPTISSSWILDVFYIFLVNQLIYLLLVVGRNRIRVLFGSMGIICAHTLLTLITLLTAFSVYSALSIKNETGPSHIVLDTCKQCYLMRVYDDYFMFWDASDRTVKVISKNEIKTLTIPVG